MTATAIDTAPVACWTDFFRPDPAFRELGLLDASPETLAAAEICIGFPSPEQIAAMPRLRWLQLMSAGGRCAQEVTFPMKPLKRVDFAYDGVLRGGE